MSKIADAIDPRILGNDVEKSADGPRPEDRYWAASEPDLIAASDHIRSLEAENARLAQRVLDSEQARYTAAETIRALEQRMAEIGAITVELREQLPDMLHDEYALADRIATLAKESPE